MAAFVISLREGIEAALIVSILLSTVRRDAAWQPKQVRAVWLGVGSAGLASILLAVGLSVLGADFSGRGEAVFEAVTLLLAAAVLTCMIFWMQEHSRTLRARLAGAVQRAIQERTPADESVPAEPPGSAWQVTAAPGRSRGWALFLVAFLAIFREGLELALFLTAAVFATSAGQTITGAVLGLAAAATLGVLLFAGTVHLSLRRFFQVTSILLILFAAGMTALGSRELVDSGLLPGIITPLWNTSRILSDTSLLGQLLEALFGYSSAPSLTEIIVYLSYFAAIGLALGWQRSRIAHLRHVTAER